MELVVRVWYISLMQVDLLEVLRKLEEAGICVKLCKDSFGRICLREYELGRFYEAYESGDISPEVYEMLNTFALVKVVPYAELLLYMLQSKCYNYRRIARAIGKMGIVNVDMKQPPISSIKKLRKYAGVDFTIDTFKSMINRGDMKLWQKDKFTIIDRFGRVYEVKVSIPKKIQELPKCNLCSSLIDVKPVMYAGSILNACSYCRRKYKLEVLDYGKNEEKR